MAEPILELRNLRKVYRIQRTALDLIRRHPNRIVALDGIDLRVAEGEAVGVLGHNGAGKSTLLRTVAGIARPTSGEIIRRGSTYPLLDMGAGLNNYLSARKNAEQRLLTLGLPRRRVADAVDGAIEFAELQDVADEPIRTYSTGMKIRLAFAIATSVEPQIFLVDEVLAVGDEFFAAKSFRRIQEMTRSGRAALIASHDWFSTFRLCSRIVWLDRGRVHREGTPEELMYDYLAALNAYKLTGRVRITDLEFLDSEGRAVASVPPGEQLTIRFTWESDEAGTPFALLSSWMDGDSGETVLSDWSLEQGFFVAESRSGTCEIHYDRLPFAPGRYDYGLLIADPSEGPFPVQFHDLWGPVGGDDTRLVVEPGEGREALLQLPARWSVETR